MKPLLILTAACLPLAVLTAWAFWDLRSVGDAPELRHVAIDLPGNPRPDASASGQLKAAKAMAEGLAEADLWTSQTLAGVGDLPADRGLHALKAAWSQWVQARQLAQRCVMLPRDAQRAAPEDLREACQELEDLKAEIEKARPPGCEGLLALLERRIGRLKGQIAQAALKSEASALFAQARAELRPKRYAQCVSLCDQWLAEYSQLDAVQAAQIRALREQARFWDDAEQMSAQWQSADSTSRRKAMIEGFLARHAGDTSRTAREQAVLERCQSELWKIETRLRAEALRRKAAEGVSRLSESPPARFAHRLQAAVELSRQYPVEEATTTLRQQVRDWLAEAIPEKAIREPPQIQETETRQGVVVRGFFREVTRPDGTLAGYQPYPTYEDYLRPVAQVGTYAQEDLLRPPGPSLLRQCLTRYGALRSSVLAQPGRRRAWEELAAGCEEFEAQLAAYRKKVGSAREPLSFQDEARLARELLDGALWADMEKLFER